MSPAAIATLVTPLVMFAALVAGVAWIAVALLRRPSPATNPSRREARMILVFLPVGLGIGAMFGLIDRLFRSHGAGLFTVGTVIFGLVLLEGLVTVPVRVYRIRKRAGRVMFRIPLSGRDRRWYLIALLFVVLITASWFMSASGGGIPLSSVVVMDAGFPLILALLAYYFVSGSQVCEHGIAAGGTMYFVAWESIRGFAWEGKDGTALRLDVQRHFPFLGPLTLSVPVAPKPALEQALREHGVPPAAWSGATLPGAAASDGGPA